MENRIIQIGDKSYKLSFEDFPEDIDLDSLFKIDISNMFAEIITFPVILNKLGIMLADADNLVAECKLNLEIYEAKRKESIRESMEKPTVDKVEDKLRQDKLYLIKRQKFLQLVKQRDYINSCYWTAKDKSDKLNKMSLSLNFSDTSLEIIDLDNFNLVSLKRKGGTNLIKD
jgi:hypothetical protein